MSQVPAGWLNDPYGRFQQRYWDGERWTEHVSTGGRQEVDPLGASTVIPIAIPGTATAGSADSALGIVGADTSPDGPEDDGSGADGSGGSGLTAFLDGLGPDPRERPAPQLRSAWSGIGGAVLAAGTLVLAAPAEDPRVVVIIVSALLLAAALAVRLGAKVAGLQAAATGIAAVAIPTFAVAATTSNGSSDFLTGALLTVLYLGAWALPGFRGHNLFLGLAALALLSALGALTSGDSLEGRCNRYVEQGDWDRYDEECYYYESEGEGFLPTDITDNIGTQGAIYLLGAGAFLGGTWFLDRRGYRGAATALAAAGLFAAFTGTLLLLDEFGKTWGPLLMIAVGVIVSSVGSHGSRRATTWWGAALAAAGIVALVITEMEPTSLDAVGGSLLIAGAVLVIAPMLATSLRRLREQPAPPVQ
jgi:MFS family permease